MILSTLELLEADRDVSSGAGVKRRQRYLDFVIDGVPLAERMRPTGLDLISPLWVDNATAAPSSLQAVERLLGRLPGDAPHGRVGVYVCSECGDLGCGAVTVNLSSSSDVVTWSAWGYQNNYSDDVDAVDEAHDGAWDSVSFDRADYEAVLAEAAARIGR